MLQGSSDPMQCSEHCAHQWVFSGWDRDKQEEEEISISNLKNPARSQAGITGEVSRKWFSDESMPVARKSPRTQHRQILEEKEKQALARPDNQKLQLALNQPLAQAGTETVRALLCGTLSAWHCLLSLCSGTLVPEKRGPSVPGPSFSALGKKMLKCPQLTGILLPVFISRLILLLPEKSPHVKAAHKGSLHWQKEKRKTGTRPTHSLT